MKLVGCHVRLGSDTPFSPPKKAFLDLAKDQGLPVFSLWHHEPLAHPSLLEQSTLTRTIPRLTPPLDSALLSGWASKLLFTPVASRGWRTGRDMQGGKLLCSGRGPNAPANCPAHPSMFWSLRYLQSNARTAPDTQRSMSSPGRNNLAFQASDGVFCCMPGLVYLLGV